MNVYIVGCGGVASYLIPPLVKVLNHGFEDVILTLIDKDILEEKNLLRQNFLPSSVGKTKANIWKDYVTLAAPKIKCDAHNVYFGQGFGLDDESVVFSLCDNHPARKNILESADLCNSAVITAGNEEKSAEAFLYLPHWKDTARDPRIRYPEILTDESDDPLMPAGSCASHERLESSGGQTASANAIAASFALQLFVTHYVNSFALSAEMFGELPISHYTNGFAIKTTKIKEAEL